ncbi:MAG: outer membrane lipoprotein chaperone LolA [Pseudomonadota bacterium]
MTYIKNFFRIVVLLSGLICATAQAADASDQLTNLLLNIKTMQADFTQTVKDKSAKALQQTHGHMALERPGKFRWEVTKPIAQLIIANGTRLWIYDADLEQVTIRSFQHAAGQTPALLLSDSTLTLNKDFDVQLQLNPMAIANYQIFILTPKNKDDPFATIKLSFLNKKIQEMRLEDRLGHVTTISFQDVQVGMPLPSTLFTFKPAANVDVIDETKNKS